VRCPKCCAATNACRQGNLGLQGVKRTSGLMAPTMQLKGHGSEVYSIAFSPSGKYLASASFDKQVFLWHVYGECENYSVLKVCALRAKHGCGCAWVCRSTTKITSQPAPRVTGTQSWKCIGRLAETMSSVVAPTRRCAGGGALQQDKHNNTHTPD
jgi:WD40 repeat protein